MTSYSSTPLSFGQLIKNCFAGYGPVYKKTWQLIFLAALLIFLTSLVHLPPALLAVMNVVLLLILAFMNAMILHRGNAGLALQNTPMQESFVVAKNKYFSFLICYVVLSISLVFLVMSLFFAALAAIGPDVATLAAYLGAMPPVLPSWLAWVFLLMMILFLVLILFLYVAPALVITQKLGAFAAFKQSINLVKGHWWKVLGILLLVHICIGIVFYLVDIFYPVQQPLIEAIRTLIFQVIVYPLPVATTLTLLHDLQLRKAA